jgi:asparagine synthase (glutamine-hydrolysing)
MCGIAGLMTRDGAPPSQAILDRLAAALAHRGPDGAATRITGDCGLVHTRLAIVDLAGGAQPLVARDGTAIVVNGEIYNDPDIRRRLRSACFATASDSESALALYGRGATAEHCLAFVEELRGMYALALHDPAAGRLVLARDPFGIKPLYVAETSAGFAFASEPQALIAAGLVAATVSSAVRDELLALQFTTGTATLFSGITRLAPGEAVAVEHGRIVARRRRAALPPPGEPPVDAAAAAAEFGRVWADSIAAHERSDVPFAMFLSGGIDSAAVLAMMATVTPTPPLAFTAAFPGTAAADERATARAVAASVGAVHVEVEISAADFWRTLPAIVAAMDDPAADYAIVPTYLLARQAARDVKVVLTGEGGDEIFAGYGRYRAALRPWPLAKEPWRHHRLAGLGLLRSPVQRRTWREGMTAVEAEVARAGYRGLQALQASDMAAWLPYDLLSKLDRCLMAHGLEGRVPFLDPLVARVAFPLPRSLKIHNGRGKWLLRRWLAEACPAAAAMAPKRGFTVPVGEWIAASAPRLAPLIAGQPGVAEVCKPDAVIDLYRTADVRHGHAMWLLLFYALWHQRHILGLRCNGDVFAALQPG